MLPHRVSRSKHTKRGQHGRVRQLKSQEVGVHIPHRVHPKVPSEGAVREVKGAPGASVPQAGGAEGETSRGRARDGGPRP